MTPHWISLIVTYVAIAGAYVLIIRLGKKCMTTAPEDSQSKTEPLPTGQTSPISPLSDRARGKIIRSSMYGKHPESEIQLAVQTHKRHREYEAIRDAYAAGRDDLRQVRESVSASSSEQSMDGGLFTDEISAAIAEAELKDKTHWDWWIASGGTSDYHLQQSHHWEAEADRLRGWPANKGEI